VEKNKVLPENFEMNVQSRDRTYGPKYYSERMAPSPEVWSRV
jgi:hypothetical protein